MLFRIKKMIIDKIIDKFVAGEPQIQETTIVNDLINGHENHKF